MLKLAPNHISPFCYYDEKDFVYQRLLEKFEASNISTNKIKCSCGNCSFNVYQDDHPTILLKCPNCNNTIVVYELEYYPAAVKLNCTFPLEPVICNGESVFEVYAIYEYGDDYEGADDISWCYVYIKSANNLIELINDETT